MKATAKTTAGPSTAAVLRTTSAQDDSRVLLRSFRLKR
jgi:hypothetical protein